MKTFQRILAVVLCLVMSLSVLGTVAFAAEGDPQTTAATIDTSKKGSITVHKYEYNGNNKGTGTGETQEVPEGATALEGVTFALYQVMTQDQMLAYYNGTDDTTVTVDNFVSQNTDGSYTVKNKDGQPVTATTENTKTTDSTGVVSFTNLALGMYVIIETSAPEKVTVAEKPFLVSVPMTKSTTDADWLYDINVYPKNSTSEGNVTLKKTDKNGSNLSGVEFTLEKKNGDTWEYVEETDNDTTFTTNASGEIVWTNLAHGDYRITETKTLDGYILDQRPIEFTIDNSSKITCSDTRACVTLDGNNSAALTITLVNEKPDSKKEITKVNGTAVTGTNVKETNASVGDVITYKVTVNVPKNIAELKTFKVTDTPTNLEYQSVESVKNITDNNSDVTGYTATPTTEKGFEIDFTKLSDEQMAAIAGDVIEITYKAKVLASAADATAAPNTVKLTYSNSILPDDSSDEPGNYEIKDGAVVYTYKLGVIKRKDSATGDVMSGVEFKLYASEDSTTPLKFTQNEDGSYVLDANGTDTLTTGDDGKIIVKGLANGTYYLEETKTADDYNLLKGRVAVELQINTTTSWNISESYVKGVLTKKTYQSATHTSDSDDITALKNTTIVNKKGFDLPTTGGIGTLMFFIIGGVLIAGGICLITVPNKKRSV